MFRIVWHHWTTSINHLFHNHCNSRSTVSSDPKQIWKHTLDSECLLVFTPLRTRLPDVRFISLSLQAGLGFPNYFPIFDEGLKIRVILNSWMYWTVKYFHIHQIRRAGYFWQHKFLYLRERGLWNSTRIQEYVHHNNNDAGQKAHQQCINNGHTFPTYIFI